MKIVLCLPRRVKLTLRRMRRQTKDKALGDRCQIVLLTAKGNRRANVAESVGRSVSWVNRVVARFDEHGVAGLLDRREDNGKPKLNEWFLSTLYDLVDASPQDYGYPRPTWTRELLAKVMHRLTGVKVHPGTMSRALQRIGARLGRPRPTGRLPVAQTPQKPAFGGDRVDAEHAAVGRGGGLPRRGGRASEPQDRLGLDEPRHAKATAHAGQQRQAIPVRGDGRSHRAADVGGRPNARTACWSSRCSRSWPRKPTPMRR